MPSFKLTPEQERFFRGVLRYISNERKSTLIQLLDSSRARSITDIVEEVGKRYPGIDSRYLPKQRVEFISGMVLSPLELATEEQIPGRTKAEVRAFRLTKKGEEVKRYAGFALEIMVKEFDQSIYPVLSVMNSHSDKTRPYEAVRLLYRLDEGSVRVRDLAENNLNPYRTEVRNILVQLLSFKDSQGKPMPLVEIKDSTNNMNIGYQWIEGEGTPTSGKPTKAWEKLVGLLSSDPKRIWTMDELVKETGYPGQGSVTHPLRNLETQGHLVRYSPNQLKVAHITSYGRRLMYSLFEPIRGAIIGDEVSRGIIDRNQPTSDSVTKVLGYYVGIKNLERAKSPS